MERSYVNANYVEKFSDTFCQPGEGEHGVTIDLVRACKLPTEVERRRIQEWTNFFAKFSIQFAEDFECNSYVLRPDTDDIGVPFAEHNVSVSKLEEIQFWVSTGDSPHVYASDVQLDTNDCTFEETLNSTCSPATSSDSWRLNVEKSAPGCLTSNRRQRQTSSILQVPRSSERLRGFKQQSVAESSGVNRSKRAMRRVTSFKPRVCSGCGSGFSTPLAHTRSIKSTKRHGTKSSTSSGSKNSHVLHVKEPVERAEAGRLSITVTNERADSSRRNFRGVDSSDVENVSFNSQRASRQNGIQVTPLVKTLKSSSPAAREIVLKQSQGVTNYNKRPVLCVKPNRSQNSTGSEDSIARNSCKAISNRNRKFENKFNGRQSPRLIALRRKTDLTFETELFYDADDSDDSSSLD